MPASTRVQSCTGMNLSPLRTESESYPTCRGSLYRAVSEAALLQIHGLCLTMESPFYSEGPPMFRRSAGLITTFLGCIVAGSALGQPPAALPEPATLWPELLQFDAAKAYQAMRQLVATPSETIGYLRENVPPATTSATDKQIADLIR